MNRDVRRILAATWRQGAEICDWRPLLDRHPEAVVPQVEDFRRALRDNLLSSLRIDQNSGISAKGLVQTSQGAYLIKPFWEKPDRGCPRPVQGWAEMTSQMLYWSQGMGHVHQKAFIAEAEETPVLVAVWERGLHPVAASANPEQLSFIRRMDQLCDNRDRAMGNLLQRPDRTLLAIDHSRCFQGWFHSPMRFKDALALLPPAWYLPTSQ